MNLSISWMAVEFASIDRSRQGQAFCCLGFFYGRWWSVWGALSLLNDSVLSFLCSKVEGLLVLVQVQVLLLDSKLHQRFSAHWHLTNMSHYMYLSSGPQIAQNLHFNRMSEIRKLHVKGTIVTLEVGSRCKCMPVGAIWLSAHSIHMD